MPLTDPPASSLAESSTAVERSAPEERRRTRNRERQRRLRAAETPEQHAARLAADRPRKRLHHRRPPRRFVAVDGEGVTGPDGVHRYVVLAACDQDGPVCPPLVKADGLDYDDCLGFLSRLPVDALVVG